MQSLRTNHQHALGAAQQAVFDGVAVSRGMDAGREYGVTGGLVEKAQMRANSAS